MPNLKEILGEAYAQIPEDLKTKYKDIDLVDSSSYVDKKELETANNTIKQYKKDIVKRDKDLEDLQGKVKDNETLNKEIEELKIANKKASEDYESKLNEISFENKFEKSLSAYNPKNVKALRALLDMEKVKLDGENFLGLEDQIKTLKESDPYLFVEENPGGTGFIGGGSSLNDDKKSKLSLGARLAEQKKNANQATELQNKFFG